MSGYARPISATDVARLIHELDRAVCEPRQPAWEDLEERQRINAVRQAEESLRNPKPTESGPVIRSTYGRIHSTVTRLLSRFLT